MAPRTLHRVAAAFVACAAIILSIGAANAPSTTRAYRFAYDGILGTSLDLTIVASSSDEAAAAERVTLAELTRISSVISTYDANSEVSRFIRAGRTDTPSRDLIAVLQGYECWEEQSGHAFTSRAGELSAVWKAAEHSGRVPDDTTLGRLARDVGAPAWRIDPTTHAVVALTTHAIDLNSLGKGYAIDRAVTAVRAAVPSLQGGMINIGGDIRVWGEAPVTSVSDWNIGVTDPFAHADNAAPLTLVTLHEGAISSSGNYARGFNIAGRHFSHIIDPRTGYPADSVVGVTVVARDNATANALATSLSVLSPKDGMRLLRDAGNAEAIVVTADGHTLRSPGFAALERAVIAPPTRPISAATVHATVSADLTMKEYNRHRPYAAVWVTDSASRVVRTLAEFGDRGKYIPELSQWYGMARPDNAMIDAVSRATRPAGQYTFEWDGRNAAGVAVAPGTYTFWLEAAYEHGPHSVKSVKLDCRAAPVSGVIEAAAGFNGAKVECSADR